MIYSGKSGLADLDDVVRAASATLSGVADRFDFIAVTGMSGVIVGAPVALEVNVPLVVVRKPSDADSHSGPIRFIGHPNGRYVFLDDFISSGATRRRVLDAFRLECRTRTQHVADYMYSDFMGKAAGLHWADMPAAEYPESYAFGSAA